MNRLARWMMLLYPSRWRKRYGDEVDALVEDAGADARVILDLVRGAVRMQFSTWSFPRLAAVLGIAGMLAGLAFSPLTPVQYIARVEMPLAGAEAPIATMQMLRTHVTSRASLANIIQDRRLDLYATQRKTLPLEDVIEQMRDAITFSLSGADHIAVQFTYPDKLKAELTAQALTAAASSESRDMNRPGVVEGPVSDIVDAPSLPVRPLRPDVWPTAIGGLIAGFSIALVCRIRLRFMFACIGTLVGIAAAWVIPAASGSLPDGMPFLRYQSQASLYVEDSDVVPVANLVTQLSSRTGLAVLIDDPRLKLYPDSQDSHSLEDVAKTMQRDFTVSIRKSGAASWIDLSFVYPDRYKAQQTLSLFIGRLGEEHTALAAKAIPTPTHLRSWGTVDTATPVSLDTVAPDRASPVLSGLLAGSVLAAIIAAFRRRRTPADEAEHTMKFNSARFRKLALWLAAAGTIVGTLVALCTPARYVSSALIAFDDVAPGDAAKLINSAGHDNNLTWHEVKSGDTQSDVFRIEFAANDPSHARSVVQDVLANIDRALVNLRGGDDKTYDAIRGVDGVLLPVTAQADLAVPVPAIEPVYTAAIPFDDDHAKPVALPEYREIAMNVIDPPILPSRPDSMGWWLAVIGFFAGLALAALLSFFDGPTAPTKSPGVSAGVQASEV